MKAYLVLENGPCFEGISSAAAASTTLTPDRAGEVVFNTSHTGYEEIATDPSYYSQIVVMTAPQMGNYGVDRSVWESRQIWIEGFVACEIQTSLRDAGWQNRLQHHGIPILSEVDTRELVLYLRDHGTPWGAIILSADSVEMAQEKAHALIQKSKNSKATSDWPALVTRPQFELRQGERQKGPRVAVIDYGCKENILRELCQRTAEVGIFSSTSSAREILDWDPSGILLSNGPGDPSQVQGAVQVIRKLLGEKNIFGICMGHQLLGLALGASTFRLKFGHRGSNHPVRDHILNSVYVTSQNHGYAVDASTLPSGVLITHQNLNDHTVEGLQMAAKKCWSVQFHPESHPGPNEARLLFDHFVEGLPS